MKRVLMVALIAVTMVSSAFATGTRRLNTAAKSSFSNEYRNVTNASWSGTEEYTKVAFNMNGNDMEVFYNPDGEKIATSTKIGLDELPVSAKRSLAKRFAGYTILEVIRLDNGNDIAYYVSAKDDKGSVILQIDADQQLSTYKESKN